MQDLIIQAKANQDALQALLIRHEGLRLKPYRDTRGKLTLGIGRNLDDVGISHDEALDLFGADLTRAQAGLDADAPFWRGLDPVRQRALIDMAFNLGATGVGEFRLMFAALRASAWSRAADEMLRSRWADQVGVRATELAAMVRTGRS